MNKDDIIRMAREAGFNPGNYMAGNLQIFKRFAAIVAAAEREACAKICDERERANLYGVYECANEIRKRGEK